MLATLTVVEVVGGRFFRVVEVATGWLDSATWLELLGLQAAAKIVKPNKAVTVGKGNLRSGETGDFFIEAYYTKFLKDCQLS